MITRLTQKSNVSSQLATYNGVNFNLSEKNPKNIQKPVTLENARTFLHIIKVCISTAKSYISQIVVLYENVELVKFGMDHRSTGQNTPFQQSESLDHGPFYNRITTSTQVHITFVLSFRGPPRCMPIKGISRWKCLVMD